MVSQIVLTGMVLVAAPINDYDKRLVVLTKERGKITVFAKGARRQNSQYAAGSRSFAFGEFTLYQGKEAYNLVGMNISCYFEDMIMDIDKLYHGMYFLELAEYFGRENLDAKDMLNLLYASLKALLKGSVPIKLIRYIFELKIFTINGEYPEVFECNKCQESTELTYFSVGMSGALCSKCKVNHADAIEVDISTIYTMQYIISSPINKLYTFTVSDTVMTELTMIMGRWINTHCDKEFKSLDFL